MARKSFLKKGLIYLAVICFSLNFSVFGATTALAEEQVAGDSQNQQNKIQNGEQNQNSDQKQVSVPPVGQEDQQKEEQYNANFDADQPKNLEENNSLPSVQAQEATTPAPQNGTPSPILINEFMPDPIGSDTGEWIELYNNSCETVTIIGWKLDDDNPNSGVFNIPTTTFVPKQIVVFTTGGSFYLNNDGDTANLFDNSNVLKDSRTYSNVVPTNHSVARVSDGGEWDADNDVVPATKGLPNAGPRTFFVDDNNPNVISGGDPCGTQDFPFKKIQDATNVVTAGDTILVEDGTYEENVVLPGGVDLASLEGPEGTIILGNGSDCVVDIGLNSSLTGFFVSNPPSVLASAKTKPSGIAIPNGIDVVGDNVLVDGNIIGGNYFGIEVSGGSSNVDLINNIIIDNTSTGIGIYGSSAANIVNNTIDGNGGAGIYGSSGSSALVLNNIISNNSSFGVEAGGGSFTADIRNNDLFNNAGGDISGGLVLGTGNISSNPLFKDLAGGDFNLQKGSPAIDTGENTGAPADDLAGVTRPQDGDLNGTAVVDMGALEFVPQAPKISGEQVQNIQSSSVEIVWQTDTDATSRIVYGTTQHPGSIEDLEGNFVSHPECSGEQSLDHYQYTLSTCEADNGLSKTTNHSVLISGLISGQTYYFRTVSHGSPSAISQEHTFITAAIGSGRATMLINLGNIANEALAQASPAQEVKGEEVPTTEVSTPGSEEGKGFGAWLQKYWWLVILIIILGVIFFLWWERRKEEDKNK